ncbi:hypothetical protein AND4_19177 [Vibrio sp. AND4]|nr:hypothetical protein AND4_19177 [Vibrio sp. AND4]
MAYQQSIDFSGKLAREIISKERIMKKATLGLALTLLAGCVATTEELAHTGDWYQIGYQDGVTGHTSRSVKELNQLGHATQGDYDQGYLDGVTEYCNPDFAYQIGLSGQYYEGVCEGTSQAQKFRMEWQRGWNEYSNQIVLLLRILPFLLNP